MPRDDAIIFADLIRSCVPADLRNKKLEMVAGASAYNERLSKKETV